jgi:HEAT repeat protein
LAAEPAGDFLGKSQAQWVADLKSESASQRHLAAWALAQPPHAAAATLLEATAHDDPVVRYWAALGLARRPAAASADQFVKLLQDPSPAVRIVAAEACARRGNSSDALEALSTSLADPQEAVRVQAISSLERLGPKSAPLKPQIEKATGDASEYVKRISTRLLARLAAMPAP